MSMISEQIKRLREKADTFEKSGIAGDGIVKELRQAADTIEELSAKLHNANMERSSAYYNNGWIPVSERLPKGSDIVLLSLPPHIDPDGEECFASVICGHYIGGRNAEWGLSDGDAFGYGLVSVRKGTNPVAWMPLPEPYKASPTGVESEGV